MTQSSDKHKLWFTRRNGVVHGPYPTLLVRRYVLLGRLVEHDEVSQDREIWYPLMAYPELIPDEFKDLDTPEGQERLRQARMREDERAKDRRKQADEVEGEARKGRDRRHPENPAMLEHRRQRASLLKPPSSDQLKGAWPLWLVIGLVVVLSTALFLWPTTPKVVVPPPDCMAAPAPGINWNHCRKAGARLNGVNLQGATLSNTDLLGASLVGANLQGTNLSYADLRRAGLERAQFQEARLLGTILQGAKLYGANLENADLSYADLRGADLQNVNLSGAKLDRTIWLNGQVCDIGSRGRCLVDGEEQN